MQKPLATAPTDQTLPPYDREHAVTYMRLLDADAEGADWHEVAECRASIPHTSRSAPAGPMRRISPAPDGWLIKATSICCGAAGPVQLAVNFNSRSQSSRGRRVCLMHSMEAVRSSLSAGFLVGRATLRAADKGEFETAYRLAGWSMVIYDRIAAPPRGIDRCRLARSESRTKSMRMSI